MAYTHVSIEYRAYVALTAASCAKYNQLCGLIMLVIEGTRYFWVPVFYLFPHIWNMCIPYESSVNFWPPKITCLARRFWDGGKELNISSLLDSLAKGCLWLEVAFWSRTDYMIRLD